MYNIVCLKWGNKYSVDYVNNLYNMVKRNCTLPFNFYCITDNHSQINKNIIIKELNMNAIGWWNKIGLFKENAFDLSGPTLFLDLDVVIVSNINNMLTYSDSFTIIKDWGSREGNVIYNSSVFFMKINEHTQVYEEFIRNNNITKSMHGDQNLITKMIKKVNFWPKEWCRSFKFECVKGDRTSFIPENSKIIIFHGKPDPHDCLEKNSKFKADWVKNFWY